MTVPSESGAAMRGILLTGDLPQLLSDLYLGGRTGLLELQRGEERVRVGFRDGRIVGVDTRSEERAAPPRPYDTASLKLHEVLAELGIRRREQVGPFADRRDRLYRTFSWSEASYTFVDGGQGPEEDQGGTISTEKAIVEAIRAIDNSGAVRRALGDTDRVLVLRVDPGAALEAPTLTAIDGQILSLVDGTLSARQVLKAVPGTTLERRKSLLSLLLRGLVEYLTSRAPLAEPLAAPEVARALPVPAEASSVHEVAPVPAPSSEPEEAPAARGEVVAGPLPPTEAEPPNGAGPGPEPPSEPVEAPAAPFETAPERRASTGDEPPVEAVPPEAAGSPPDEEERAALDALRTEVRRAYAGLGRKNHFEVLGVPEAASATKIEEAYALLKKRFEPDAHPQAALADLRDEMEAVYLRIDGAHEVLSHPESRAEYQAELARRRARETGSDRPLVSIADPTLIANEEEKAWIVEERIHTAERSLAGGNFYDTIQVLEGCLPSITLKKQKVRAQLLLARAYIRNPNWIKRGEEVLHSIVHEDPQNADAYFLLGKMYKDKGLQSRAEGMFRRTLELKPGYKAAAAELSSEAPLLKKLLGRLR